MGQIAVGEKWLKLKSFIASNESFYEPKNIRQLLSGAERIEPARKGRLEILGHDNALGLL